MGITNIWVNYPYVSSYHALLDLSVPTYVGQIIKGTGSKFKTVELWFNEYTAYTADIQVDVYLGTGTYPDITKTGSSLATATVSITGINDFKKETFVLNNEVSTTPGTYYMLTITVTNDTTTVYTPLSDNAYPDGCLFNGTASVPEHDIFLTVSYVRNSPISIYVRDDGTATNVDGATNYTSAATSLNITNLNANEFLAGDTILLSTSGSGGGIYTSAITIAQSGTAENPITIKNVNGQNPKFITAPALTSWGGPDGNGSYTKTVSGSVEAVFEDGVPLKWDNASAYPAGSFYQVSTTLYWKPSDGSSSHTVRYVSESSGVGNANAINIDNQSYITITKNTSGTIYFENCGWTITAGVRNNVGVTSNMDGIIINGLDFKWCLEGLMIDLSSNSIHTTGTFSNNNVYRNCNFLRIYGDGGMDYATWNIFGNTGDGVGTINGTDPWGSGYGAAGSLLPSGSYDQEYIGLQNPDGCNIYNNTSINSCCYWCYLYPRANGFAQNNNIYNNFVYENRERKIITIGGTQPYTIDNNKIYNNIFVNGYPDTPTGSSDYIIIDIWDAASNTDACNNYFYNNVLIGGERQVWIHSEVLNPDETETTWKNNIFIALGNSANVYTNDITYNLFDYNCYYNSFSSNIAGTADGNRTWTQWTVTDGQEAGGINSNPLLVNASGTTAESYKPQTTSPCIGAGVWTGSNLTDYEGKAQYNQTGGVSIGAYRGWKSLAIQLPTNLGE